MNESLHLYLSGTEAMLRVRSGAPLRHETVDLAAWDWLPGSGSLQAPCAVPRGRWRAAPLHVYAGAGLCRFGVFDLPDGVKAADIDAVGRAKLAHELGLDAARWRFTCDHDRRRGKLVAAAVRADAVAAAEAFALANKLQLVSVRPFGAVLANLTEKALAGTGQRTLLAIERDALNCFTFEGGEIVAAASLPHDGQPGALQRAVQRLTLNQDSAAAGELLILAYRAVPWILDGLMDRLLAPGDYLRHARHADFRDLMFDKESAACG
ncbi:hypothetical protein [Massilia sp. METH4]|uniref:hypothetical protein n=1 Tax=Massilia sp. METH4 TaxID=3123041 RepID=UPI0030CABB6A